MQPFRYYTINPPPQLAPYVRSFWVFEGTASTHEPYVYRSMADPCAELVFHYQGVFYDLGDDDQMMFPRPGSTAAEDLAILQGPSRKYKRFVTHENFGIFGAYLYPFAIPDLFGISSGEIIGCPPALELAAGKTGQQLTAQILGAPGNRQRADILGNYLLKQLRKIKRPDDAMHRCVREVLHHTEPIIVSDIATKYCISERQLERKFKTLTGFAPKTFARISRFHHALNSYGGSFKNLTDIAHACGYYDQSHFIHDFREFSGYEPSLYFAGKGEGIEYRDA